MSQIIKTSLCLLVVGSLMVIAYIHILEGAAEDVNKSTIPSEEMFCEATKVEKDTIQVENTTTKLNVEAEKAKEVVLEKTTPAVLSPYKPNDTYYYDISYDDKVMIAKVVWAESRGECFEGKVAVAAVVLNRYFYGLDEDFNRESIASVITQQYQFASITNVTMQDLEQVPGCMEAVEAACKGWDPTRQVFPDGALYLYAPKHIREEEALKREGVEVFPIGNHNFHFDFQID